MTGSGVSKVFKGRIILQGVTEWWLGYIYLMFILFVPRCCTWCFSFGASSHFDKAGVYLTDTS